MSGSLPEHGSVRSLAVLAGLLTLAIPRASLAELPRESPLYGSPYRRGPAAEIALGVALCQPSPIHASVCGPRGGSAAIPGVALRLGLGWRFNPYWQLSAAWIRQGHRPGGSFTNGRADGAMLAVRGIVPLPTVTRTDSHVDLGFELGLGWSQRVLQRDAAPLRLSSSGAVLRPAVILEGWVIADLAIGVELATQLNFHWQYCADQLCEPLPGAWVGSGLEQRWVDGFSIAVRATGLFFPHF